MKIKIEHLGYTVFLKQPHKSKEHDFKVWTERIDDNSCCIYFPRPITRIKTPTLAHEVTHVLQLIAESRHISFTDEKEHLAYIMQYLMTKILDYEYDV